MIVNKPTFLLNWIDWLFSWKWFVIIPIIISKISKKALHYFNYGFSYFEWRVDTSYCRVHFARIAAVFKWGLWRKARIYCELCPFGKWIIVRYVQFSNQDEIYRSINFSSQFWTKWNHWNSTMNENKRHFFYFISTAWEFSHKCKQLSKQLFTFHLNVSRK